MKKILSICLILFICSSCQKTSNSTICTDEFRYITIQVLTQNQESAHLQEFSVIDKNTGQEVDLCHADMCGNQGFIGNTESGLYTIMHDHFSGKINGELELTVSGTATDGAFSETFVIEDDGCHVSKISGPNQVILSS